MSEGLEQGRGQASGDRVAAWPQGLLLAAQAMLPTMGAMLLVPVVPLLIAEFGQTPNAQYLIPAILTMPALCIALLSPLAGWLGDRMGRRNLLIGALCFYGLAGMSPLLLHGIWAVISSRVVLGICEALIITLSATLIGDYFVGKPRDRWLAMISTIASLSAVVFLAVAGAVGAAFGWRWVTAVYGLSILFVPAMLLLSWEPKRGPVPAQPSEGPVEAFPWNHMVVTGLTSLFGGTLFYSLVIQQGIALSSLGVQDPARLGLLTALASLANPVGTLVFWRVSHWRASLLLAIEFAIIGSACVVIGFVQTDIQFAMAAAMGLFGCGLLLPTLISWTMRSLPFSGRARGTGIFQSMLMLGQFVSGVLLALLTTSISGSILKSFAVIGAAALLAALVAAATLRTRRPAEGPVATES
jgi:MFS family permease